MASPHLHPSIHRRTPSQVHWYARGLSGPDEASPEPQHATPPWTHHAEPLQLAASRLEGQSPAFMPLAVPVEAFRSRWYTWPFHRATTAGARGRRTPVGELPTKKEGGEGREAPVGRCVLPVHGEPEREIGEEDSVHREPRWKSTAL